MGSEIVFIDKGNKAIVIIDEVYMMVCATFAGVNSKLFKRIMTKGILSIGQAFPAFKKAAVVSLEKGKEFFDISSDDLINDEGRDGHVLVAKGLHFCLSHRNR